MFSLTTRQLGLAPLRYPGKVPCAGANYYDHLEEMQVPDARNKAAQRLFFFSNHHGKPWWARAQTSMYRWGASLSTGKSSWPS